MMKKWFSLSLFFFLSYMVFIIATLPLAFVVNQSELPKNISIQSVTGTLWQGDIAQITLDNYVINEVKTQLSFWSLITLMPTVDMTFGNDVLSGPQGKLSFAISQSTLQLSNVSVLLGAGSIAKRLQLPLPVSAKGEVELTLSDITIALDTYQCNEARGKVSWARAGVVAMQKNIKFGKLAANIGCDEGKLLATVVPKNDLGLSFNAYLSANGSKVNVSGDGHLKPGARFPEGLRSALPFIGRPDSQGRYRLRF